MLLLEENQSYQIFEIARASKNVYLKKNCVQLVKLNPIQKFPNYMNKIICNLLFTSKLDKSNFVNALKVTTILK